MNFYENKMYKNDVLYVSNIIKDWDKIKGKSILISGATGMIGSFLIDVIMDRNVKFNDEISIIAIGRNITKAKERFAQYWEDSNFKFISQDVNEKIVCIDYDVNFIIHCASNTHPVDYSTKPISTITTNVIGTYNLLNFSVSHNVERFVFLSSVEIYGENRGDTNKFSENYCGYIDCNTLRAGYPESKRTGEALCKAFIKEHNLDIVIPRLSRVYGPSMLMSDTKAISQFIKKGIKKDDIILKSEGKQFYSYTYVADAVSAILKVLFSGKCGEAYNISDDNSDITLKDLAELIAKYVGTKVIFELPNAIENSGYSKATKAIMDNEKICRLNWEANYDIQTGLERTIDILSKCYDNNINLKKVK